MAKKRPRKSGAATTRDRPRSRRRSRLPVLILTIITALAALALVVFGLLNTSSPIH